MIRNSKSDIHCELSVLRSPRDKVRSQKRMLIAFTGARGRAGVVETLSPRLARNPGSIRTSPCKEGPRGSSMTPSAYRAAVMPLFGACLKAKKLAANTRTVWLALSNSGIVLGGPKRWPGRWRSGVMSEFWLKVFSCLWPCHSCAHLPHKYSAEPEYVPSISRPPTNLQGSEMNVTASLPCLQNLTV